MHYADYMGREECCDSFYPQPFSSKTHTIVMSLVNELGIVILFLRILFFFFAMRLPQGGAKNTVKEFDANYY